MQPHEDCRDEAEYSFVKGKNAKTCKWEACSTFPVLERKGGPPSFGWWGKVERGMSEYRNNGNMWHFFLCVKDKNAKAV